MRWQAAQLLLVVVAGGLITAAAADPASQSAGAPVAPPGVSFDACGGTSVSVDQSFAADAVRDDYVWTPFAVRPDGAVGGVALAQTLTAGVSGRLAGVSLRLRGRDLVGDLPVELREGSPDGSLLARGMLPRAALEAGGWIDVALEPAARVRSGDVVAIVLPALPGTHDADSSRLQPLVHWLTSPGDDGYPGGTSFAGDRARRDPGVSAWGEFPNDRHFRTYVCGPPATSIAAPSPPPVSGDARAAALLLAGLAGAGLMVRRLGRPAS